MHNNDIGTPCIIMTSATFKNLPGNAAKVSNCHKSERSRNKNDLPYFIVVLVIIWGLPGLVGSFLGEKLRFLFFMFAERLKLIKGRKQFHTAPHLKFDKFHHNKRIALKLQRCVLGSLIYLPHRLFFLMGSRSYFKPLNTPPKYETHLSWYTFSFEVHILIFASCISTTKLPSAGEKLSEIVHKQKATLRSPERSV